MAIAADDRHNRFYYWFAKKATMYVLMAMLAPMYTWHSNHDKMITKNKSTVKLYDLFWPPKKAILS